jgi:hypothetical protein
MFITSITAGQHFRELPLFYLYGIRLVPSCRSTAQACDFDPTDPMILPMGMRLGWLR